MARALLVYLGPEDRRASVAANRASIRGNPQSGVWQMSTDEKRRSGPMYRVKCPNAAGGVDLRSCFACRLFRGLTLSASDPHTPLYCEGGVIHAALESGADSREQRIEADGGALGEPGKAH